MVRIYVSSTFKDLEECREKVRVTLKQMSHEDIAMEYYVAEDRKPVDKCLEDVVSCDLYIGIFAWRYGFVPKGYDKSITELEYRKAVETGKNCLIFLLHEEAPWPRNFIDRGEDQEKIEALRNELSAEKEVSFFKSAVELASFVGPAVRNWEIKSKIENQVENKEVLKNDRGMCDRKQCEIKIDTGYNNNISKKAFGLFYLPAQNIIRKAEKFKINQSLELWVEIKKYKTDFDTMDTSANEYADRYVKEELKKLEKNAFQAENDTFEAFEKYLYEENENGYLELLRLIDKDVENYKKVSKKQNAEK